MNDLEKERAYQLYSDLLTGSQAAAVERARFNVNRRPSVMNRRQLGVALDQLANARKHAREIFDAAIRGEKL